MVEKIKNNLSKIVMYGCLISIFFVAVQIIPFLDNSLTEETIISLAQYGLIMASYVVILVLNSKNKLSKRALTAPVVLFLSAFALFNVYRSISNNGTYILSYIAYDILYVGTIVLYLSALTSEKMKVALKVCFGIITLIFLSSVLGGSTMSISLLFAILLFDYKIFIENGKDEE